jgi:hypothetical protein
VKSLVLSAQRGNNLFRRILLSNDTVYRRISEFGVGVERVVSSNVAKSPVSISCLDEYGCHENMSNTRMLSFL